jgi:hypothetical protein
MMAVRRFEVRAVVVISLGCPKILWHAGCSTRSMPNFGCFSDYRQLPFFFSVNAWYGLVDCNWLNHSPLRNVDGRLLPAFPVGASHHLFRGVFCQNGVATWRGFATFRSERHTAFESAFWKLPDWSWRFACMDTPFAGLDAQCSDTRTTFVSGVILTNGASWTAAAVVQSTHENIACASQRPT